MEWYTKSFADHDNQALIQKVPRAGVSREFYEKMLSQEQNP